jgi:hypothetical protein
MPELIQPRGFKAIYRTIVQDLAHISRLGKFHEVISSRVAWKPGARYRQHKVEPEMYRGKASFFKVPM